MGIRTLGALVAVGLLSACADDTVAPEPAVQVVTDATQYARQSAVIQPTLVNPTDRPVYMYSCSASTTLERLEAGRWRNLGAFWYATCLAAPSEPYPIPGHTSVSLPALPKEIVAGLEVGTYRIRVAVYGDSERPGSLLPEEQRVSAPFLIVNGIR